MRQYAFSLGETPCQLGTTTYTILGYDETTVSLSDPKYPLLSEDMPRDVFEQRLRESPANDRLIAEAQGAEPQPGPVAETVEVIPAEENHLPYDVVIQTIRAEERAARKTRRENQLPHYGRRPRSWRPKSQVSHEHGRDTDTADYRV